MRSRWLTDPNTARRCSLSRMSRKPDVADAHSAECEGDRQVDHDLTPVLQQREILTTWGARPTVLWSAMSARPAAADAPYPTEASAKDRTHGMCRNVL